MTRRGRCGKVRRFTVIARSASDEAIQLASLTLIASLALAMTGKTPLLADGMVG
jgi:hypothetical protein